MRLMSSSPPVADHAATLSVAAQPERTDGRRVGVLVSHGFTGSPFSVRPWAEALAAEGYAVEMPRLPGHGTTWQDMNTTGWADWHAEIERAFAKLTAENDVVFVAGLSMGGALALRLAADHPGEVAGVILVNPAVHSERFDVKLLPVVKHLVAAFPAIGNDIKKPGGEEHAYPKTPLKAAHSMFSAYKVLRGDLGRIVAPILYFRSREDHVVDPSSSRIIGAGVSSADYTERMLEDSYHVATVDNDAETIHVESIAVIRRILG